MFKGNRGNVNIVGGNLMKREKVWGGKFRGRGEGTYGWQIYREMGKIVWGKVEMVGKNNTCCEEY